MGKHQNSPGASATGIIEREHEPVTDLDKLWNVIILNDDQTTFDFVISLLKSEFSKSQEEAEEITSRIHNRGRGIAGTYTLEIADTKRHDATQQARSAGFPLQLEIEENE